MNAPTRTLAVTRRDGVPVLITAADVDHMQTVIETLRTQRDRAEDQRDQTRSDLNKLIYKLGQRIGRLADANEPTDRVALALISEFHGQLVAIRETWKETTGA